MMPSPPTPASDPVTVYHLRNRTLRRLSGRVIEGPDGFVLLLPNRQWVPLAETVESYEAAWEARAREVLGGLAYKLSSQGAFSAAEVEAGVTLDFVGLIFAGGHVVLYPVRHTAKGYSVELPWGVLTSERAAVGFVADVVASTVAKNVVGVIYDVR